MLTKETAARLVMQELGALPGSLAAAGASNGTIEMYIVHMGRYAVTVTACGEETLKMTVWHRGQQIQTYHDAKTLKEDGARGAIEQRAREAERIRNAIVRHGVDWCRRVHEEWEALLRAELDDEMRLGPPPDAAIVRDRK